MPKPDYSQPINAADAAARRAFRELLKRDGIEALASFLGANTRTIERIGITRDVPPGIARELVNYLIASPVAASIPDDEDRWSGAFLSWAEDCRQRTEAQRG